LTDTKNSEYDLIAKHDGEYCKLCGATAAEKKLIVTNKTVYVVDEDSDKKILLCINCLTDRRLYELCVSEREKVNEVESYVTELQVSRQKETRFRLYVFERLSESKSKKWEEHDLINSAAEVIGISPTTARRYLDKMCSSAGVLLKVDDGDKTRVSFNLIGWEIQ